MLKYFLGRVRSQGDFLDQCARPKFLPREAEVVRKLPRLLYGSCTANGLVLLRHRDDMWTKYQNCKKALTQGLRRARSEYINNTIAEAFDTNDTKPFWKFIKAQRKDTTGVAPLKRGGKLFSDGQTKADILNRQFSSVFTREDFCNIPELPGPH